MSNQPRCEKCGQLITHRHLTREDIEWFTSGSYGRAVQAAHIAREEAWIRAGGVWKEHVMRAREISNMEGKK